MLVNFLSKTAEEPPVASVVLTGAAIVFGMLVLFVIIFSIFGLFSKKDKAAKTENKTKPSVNSSPAPVYSAPTTTEDDDIIAVIAAAVYSMYEGTGKKAVIRSIRPSATNGRSAWATAGLMNNIKSF